MAPGRRSAVVRVAVDLPRGGSAEEHAGPSEQAVMSAMTLPVSDPVRDLPAVLR